MPPRRETTVVLVHQTDTGVQQSRLSAEEIPVPGQDTGTEDDLTDLVDQIRTEGGA